jgi:hypothetical protein
MMVMVQRRAVPDQEFGDTELSRIKIADAFLKPSEMKESDNDIRSGRVIMLPENRTGRDRPTFPDPRIVRGIGRDAIRPAPIKR